MPYIVWQRSHTTMKMTMHIDDALLENVIQLTGASSKTEAVHIALREMDRKARLREYGRKGLGLTKAELMAAVDPAYDLMALRVADGGTPSGGAEADAAPTVPGPVRYKAARPRRKRN
jgi:Arc/MetJ family transcription regulator